MEFLLLTHSASIDQKHLFIYDNIKTNFIIISYYSIFFGGKSKIVDQKLKI